MNLNEQHRNAFTLVEILAVLVVISIMAGMILTAAQGVTTTAKAARTRSIIAMVDSVIQEQYDSYRYRPFSVEPPDSSQLTPSGDTFGYELLATESARVRMLMVRDLKRMEMPDRLSDIANAPAVLSSVANPVLKDTADHDNDGDFGEIIGIRNDNSQRLPFIATWFDALATYVSGGHNIPAKLAAYRDRIPATKSDGNAFNINATTSGDAEPKNQGAECLYLIMATTFAGGQPAITHIPASNIGDTDGDNLLEILDGWGQPLGFIRWPVGYNDPQRSIDATKPDEFDPFRSDFAYVSGATAALATDVNYIQPPGTSDPLHPTQTTRPWSMRPLIVSAGSDGEFGIALNPWTDEVNAATEQVAYSYRASSLWPVDTAHMGYEIGGRMAPYQMIDPYMRNFIAANQTSGKFSGLAVGQDIPETADRNAAEKRADNITNYALQSE